VQEDRSFDDFCQDSFEEASIWELDPADSENPVRIYQMDRSSVPDGQVDSEPDDCGNWESSGIIDVTDLFDDNHGCQTLLLANTQAHGIKLGNEDLVEGGQIFFLCKE